MSLAPLTDAEKRDELQRSIVANNNDLCAPIYQDENRDARVSLYAESGEEQTALSKAFGLAPWKPQAHDDDERPIWLAFAKLVPALGLVNAQATDPNTSAFHWAKVRCIMAGAGYAHHDAIAGVLTSLYPVCDMAMGETEADWIKALQNARTICGWPANLARVNWQAVVRALTWVDKTDPPVSWHRAIAALHILKHVRTRGDKLAVVHGGISAMLPMPESNIIALTRSSMAMVTQALGCPQPHGKEIHPLTLAMQTVLRQISIDRLLIQRPLAELPGTVIAGPWSSCEPDPMASDGFVQTGLRLSGVWNASNGAVREYTGSPVDAIAWAWNTTNPGDHAETKQALIASMPKTYPTSWPADMIVSDFPNIDLGWATDPDMAKVLLELPIFASLLRRTGDPLSREFPFVLLLPDVPTMEDSTNQGKTALTRMLIRAMSPGAPTVVPPDTNSAPDNRAFVDQIISYGTVGLDEWTPPQSRSHPLSHQNLQTLCTGGGVTFGRVLENSGLISLRHSLVAGAKAVDFPPDMISRTITWPLKQFTEQERNRGDVKARVDSGQASLQLRLACLHQIETHVLAERLAQAPSAVNSVLRFDAHAQLACILYERRTGRTCTTLGQTVREMRDRLSRHVNEAATSGVLSAQEGGGYLTVRVPDLFAGCGPDTIGLLIQELQVTSTATERLLGRGWNNSSQLLDALRKTRGFPTLQAMLPAISGGRKAATDRQIVMALNRSLKSLLPENGTFEIPETGFTLERGPDASNSARIRIVQASILQSPAGQNDTWNLA